ncbi:MAG: hypothetical protein Q8Q26_16195 [Pseudorhodobacter sp.]|nr:hypothetical protein [Pseudorhodobacter sp.]
MTTSVAEWMMASATVVTGCFVAWQSLLLRETLNSPFQSNLQVREIDACAAAIRAKGTLIGIDPFRDTVINEILDSKKPPVPKPLIDRDMVVDPEAGGYIFDKEGFFGSAVQGLDIFGTDAARNFRASLAELAIYSTESTITEIEAVMNSVPTISFGMLGVDGTKPGSFQNTIERFNPIEAKCRSMMLGETKGLL